MANSSVTDKNMVNSSEQKIQYTNDYSTLSKCSTAKFGYIKDDYISELMPFSHRRSPLIHMGYYVRCVVIDSVLERYLKSTVGKSAQIVSLGAGFDSTYFKLTESSNAHPGIVYYEVDFEDVVERKAAILDGSELLSSIVGKLAVHPDVGFGGTKYWLIACDLRNLSALEQKLMHADIDFTAPTLFLAECSITYMDERSSSSLIRWAATKFANATFVTYEQVYPDDGFGIVMQKHFQNQGSPLLSLMHHPTIHAQEQRYLSRNWSTCHVRSAWDVYNYLTDRTEQMRVLKIEPFDEFEEWHLKCCHYALVVASQGTLHKWADNLFENIPKTTEAQRSRTIEWTECKIQNDYSEGTVERYAHGSTYVPLCHSERLGAILLVGGFGVCASGHKRIDDISVITDLPVNDEEEKSRIVRFDVDGLGEGRSPLASMHPTCTTLRHNKARVMGRVLVFGGRLSPSKVANQEGLLLHMPLALPGNKACVTLTKLTQPGTVWDRPRARWRHTAIQIPPGASQPWARVLVFGGRSPAYEVFGDLWMLTVAAEVGRVTFKKLDSPGPQPCPRFAHSAAALRERVGMVVSGGMNQEFQALGDVWVYDAMEKHWRKLHLIGPELIPRYSHSSVVYNSLLVMVGGVNTIAGHQPGVCVVNLKTRACLEYALPAQDPEKPILLHNHTMDTLTEDGSIQLIVGGGGNCFSFGTAYNKSLLKLDLNCIYPRNRN